MLPIAHSATAREESSQLLNSILADSMVLYAMYKKHHWLVASPTFYQLHLLFDKHADEQNELIDLLAERVQSLGGIAVGDPRHAAELTAIDRPPNGAADVPAMIHRLLDAHEIVIEKIRKAIDKTEASKDWGSNDLPMGDVLRRHELQVWFVAEHVVDPTAASATFSTRSARWGSRASIEKRHTSATDAAESIPASKPNPSSDRFRWPTP